ncbi:MAG: TVP38/TMEM64 family protein [Alphaproteobacteria bacterium]|nr:TVP38/TMEM64 family protein [Alphaproteobacteria bacterium]
MKKILPLLLLIAGTIVGFYVVRHYNINLQTLQAEKDVLKDSVNNNFMLTALGFMLVYIAVVAFSLPIASLLTLSSGFLFGTFVGGSLSVISATIGASIIFWVAKTSLGENIRKKAEQSQGIYKRVAAALEDNVVAGMLFLRLIPLFPFFLINIVPAFYRVSLPIFFITTLVGIAPATFVYANLGKQLGDISSLRNLVSPQLILAFTALGLLALVPIIYKKMRPAKKSR